MGDIGNSRSPEIFYPTCPAVTVTDAAAEKWQPDLKTAREFFPVLPCVRNACRTFFSGEEEGEV